MVKKVIWYFVLLFHNPLHHAFNRFNHVGYDIPQIAAYWEHGGQTYALQNSHLSYESAFSFNIKQYKRFFLEKNKFLTSRSTHALIPVPKLIAAMHRLLNELQQHRRKFTDFTVLQDKNFNFNQQCGSLILSFNEYPFVLKLFMETPETYINPYCKGIEPICFHYMGLGAGRHNTGFTRLTNLLDIHKKLKKLPAWQERVVLPRKWLWVPPQSPWIVVEGKNIKKSRACKTKIPGTYAIIADRFTAPKREISGAQKRQLIVDICNALELSIDPHSKNFVFYTSNNTTKIVIIDTEHFPTMVGLKKPKVITSHSQWYTYLVKRCFKATYLCTKNKRKSFIDQRCNISCSNNRTRAEKSESVSIT